MEPYLEYLDDSMDMKEKLKAQLNELQEEVRSICSDRDDSPRASFIKQSSPITKLYSPIEKPRNKSDELLDLKKEVSAWSGCIKDMQKTIEKLTKQLGSLEHTFVNRDYATELQDFKEEIIQEIKNMEFGTSSFRESGQTSAVDVEEVFKRMLRNWEDQVYKPQITLLEQKVKSRAAVKEDPQEIMKKLKEKLALKAELEKRKQMLHEDSSNEDRFKLKPSKY